MLRMPTLRLSEVDVPKFNLNPLEFATVLWNCEQMLLEVSRLRGFGLAPIFLGGWSPLLEFLPLHVSTPAIRSASVTSARFMRGVGRAA